MAKKQQKQKSYSRLPHIEDETLDEIVRKLEEMRRESLEVVNAHRAADRKPNRERADVGDDIDHASEDRDREFNLLMHERHLRRLQQIDEAFDKLDDGTYGLCEGTDEPINPRRLLIMPLARYSLAYQQQQEKVLGRSMEEQGYEEETPFEAEEE